MQAFRQLEDDGAKLNVQLEMDRSMMHDHLRKVRNMEVCVSVKVCLFA